MADADYGSFIGAANPISGDEENSVTELIGYAMDRVADELLTPEQLLGVLNFACDAIEARDAALRVVAEKSSDLISAQATARAAHS